MKFLSNLFAKYAILLVPAVMLIFILASLTGDLVSAIEPGCPWKTVAPPPGKPRKLLGLMGIHMNGQVRLFIQAEDEKIYSIVPDGGQWSMIPEVPEYSVCGSGNSCNYSLTKFSPSSKPFTDLVDCVEAQGCIDAPFPVTRPPIITVVLDQDGIIWYCAQRPKKPDTGLSLTRLWMCSVAGLLVGFFLFVYRSRALKVQAPEMNNQSSSMNSSIEHLSTNDPKKIQYWGPKIYQCPNCSKLNHLRDGNYCMACETRLADSDVIDNPFL